MLRVWCLGVVIFGLINESAAAKDVRVGVSEFSPLVVKTEEGYTGLEIQIWEAVANRLDLNPIYVDMEFPSLLPAVQKGDLDVGLAGVSITSDREEKVDFSHPTANGSLGVVVLAESEISIVQGMQSFLQPNVMRPIIYLILFIMLCGNVVWYVERGSESIDDKYFPGIFEAFWWAVVTMTTVGYGDIAPRKWTGRIAGVFVMMSGIMFFGWFVAVLSSSLTFEQLTNDVRVESDLQGKTIATVSGTLAEDYLSRVPRTKVVGYATLDEAIAAVKAKSADGVVFDRLPLVDYISSNDGSELQLTEAKIKPHHYGIVVPDDSEFLEEINRELLELQESGVYAAMLERWVGQE